MKYRCSIIVIILLIVVLFSSCNLLGFSELRSADLTEDFEGEEVSERLYMYTAGNAELTVLGNGGNGYLLFDLQEADSPDNIIVFGFDSCNKSIPWGYDISFSLYIEEIEEEGQIAILTSTSENHTEEPDFLFFTNEEGSYEFHGGTEDYPATAQWNSGGYTYPKNVVFSLDEWITVKISTDTASLDEDPSWHTMAVGDWSASDRTFEASPYQRFYIKVTGGAVRFRLDNLIINAR